MDLGKDLNKVWIGFIFFLYWILISFGLNSDRTWIEFGLDLDLMYLNWIWIGFGLHLIEI